jgi:hypothetical protein
MTEQDQGIDPSIQTPWEILQAQPGFNDAMERSQAQKANFVRGKQLEQLGLRLHALRDSLAAIEGGNTTPLEPQPERALYLSEDSEFQ